MTMSISPVDKVDLKINNVDVTMDKVDVTVDGIQCICDMYLCQVVVYFTLSVELGSFASSVVTPRPVLEGIWKKTLELVSNPQETASAPGCSPLSRMVESKSTASPHLVSPGKEGKFTGDGSCPNYKTFGVCFHTVAVAEVNWMLLGFIDNYKKQKKPPNMPTGRGRKGTEPPRKRRSGTPLKHMSPSYSSHGGEGF